MSVTAQELQKVQSTQSLSIIDNVNLQQVSATMQKIAQFQAVVQKTLKKDHDYGVIPGTGRFQFLIGRLDTGRDYKKCGIWSQFQFLIGRLDTSLLRPKLCPVSLVSIPHR